MDIETSQPCNELAEWIHVGETADLLSVFFVSVWIWFAWGFLGFFCASVSAEKVSTVV